MSYRHKNRLLLICSLLFSILVYWLSLSQTMNLHWQVRELKSHLENAQAAPSVVSRLQVELAGYEQKLGRFSAGGADWQGHLTGQLAFICQQNRVTIITLPTPWKEEQNGYGIQTSTIKLEGNYKDLLSTIHMLEETEAIGRITSLSFIVEEDRKTKKTSLFAYVYIQNIEKGGTNEI